MHEHVYALVSEMGIVKGCGTTLREAKARANVVCKEKKVEYVTINKIHRKSQEVTILGKYVSFIVNPDAEPMWVPYDESDEKQVDTEG